MRKLSIGMQGPDVMAVQQGLNTRRTPQDTPLREDGNFGPKTDAAVRRFQERHHLQVDGIVGPRTRAALFPLAVVTVRAFGARLLDRPLFPSRFAANPTGPSLFSPPTLTPSISGYQPLAYPLLPMPIQSPLLSPAPLLPITIPVHHFEISPGSSISLGRPVDVNFTLTLSAIVMIGDEDENHQEFSTGIAASTPGVFSGGDWTVGWFAQFTHVQQLGRAKNWSWQPNAQAVIGNGTGPFLSVQASPAVVQWDLNKRLSLSFGGPSVTALFAPEGATLSWGLGSFGVVGKFN